VFSLATPGSSLGAPGCRSHIPGSAVVLSLTAEVGPVGAQPAGTAAPDLTTFTPCAGGQYLRWTSGGTPYVAFLSSGPRADPADVRRMRTVLSGLRPSASPISDAAGPPAVGRVLASGDGSNLEIWSTTAPPTRSTLSVIDGATHRVLGTADASLLGRAPLILADASSGGTHVLFGYVRSDATDVELTRPDGTVVGHARIVPLGTAKTPRYNAFWREGALPAGSVTWIPVNAEGQTLMGWDPSTLPGTTIGSGTYLGNPWGVSAAMKGSEPCVFLSLDSSSTCLTRVLAARTPEYVSAGVAAAKGSWDHRTVVVTVPPTVRTIVLTYRGRTTRIATHVAPPGFPHVRLAAFLLPGSDVGRMAFLDAAGKQRYPAQAIN
jgi:hypothetical protein